MNILLPALLCALAVGQASGQLLLPSPKTDSLLCSRTGPSRICDPDGFLTRHGADHIEKVLDAIVHAEPPYAAVPCKHMLMITDQPGFEVAVGIKIDLKHHQFPTTNASEYYRQRVVPLLFESWDLGGAVCKSGVLVLVDAITGKAHIYADEGAEGWLPGDKASDILFRAEELLRERRFDEALLQIVQDIGLSIAGQHPKDPWNWRWNKQLWQEKNTAEKVFFTILFLMSMMILGCPIVLIFHVMLC